MKRQRGQAIVESLLLLVMFLGFAYLIKAGLEESQFVQKIVSGPWQGIEQIAERGVWTKDSDYHPNSRERWLTMNPPGSEVCQ